MARGFDSKSVEDQIADGQHQKDTDAKKLQAARESATVSRERQSLELQKERILSERTSSPHRRSALEAALTDIEKRIASLG
jgi:hypothetical protein